MGQAWWQHLIGSCHNSSNQIHHNHSDGTGGMPSFEPASHTCFLAQFSTGFDSPMGADEDVSADAGVSFITIRDSKLTGPYLNVNI